MNKSTISKLLEGISRQFSNISDTPMLDAQVLIAHVLDQPRTWVLAHPESILLPREIEILNIAISKIESGTPLPYIIGSWDFYGRKFMITPDVLIPRPETELMVEKALSWIDNRLDVQPNAKMLCADIGCGSGCIGISLAANLASIHVIASDLSFPALAVASKNASLHKVTSQFHLVQCDLIPPTSFKFDIICANLPYIPTQTLHQLKIYKKEPTLALDGGLDGLDIIKRLLIESPKHLAAGGLVLLEINSPQAASIKKLAHEAFPDALIDLLQDLAGNDRLISIQQGK